MNFLAHIYLSGDDHSLMIGNFIADHIKGNATQQLPQGIKNGISLHRKIDHYTDHHPTVLLSKQRMRPVFGKYSPVVTDIFYDHFLAVHWHKYNKTPLNEYAVHVYNIIQKNNHLLPERTLKMLPHMISGNWLLNYNSIEGINKVMGGMARRARFESGMENAAAELTANYKYYEKEFISFFTDLENFTLEQPERKSS